MDQGWAAVAAGTLGVLGALFGVALSAKITAAQDVRRMRREDQIRFQERLLVACQEFSLCSLQLATAFSARSSPSIPVVEAFARSEQLITFLGSEHIRLAAAKIRTLLDASSGGVTEAQAEAYRERLRQMRLQFDNAVRQELSLPTSDPDAFFKKLEQSLGFS
jgi:hypothetical protein